MKYFVIFIFFFFVIETVLHIIYTFHPPPRRKPVAYVIGAVCTAVIAEWALILWLKGYV